MSVIMRECTVEIRVQPSGSQITFHIFVHCHNPMEPFKNCYSPIFYAELARDVRTIFPSFDGEKFLQTIMPSEFESMELKDRMQHTARVLHDFLPEKWTESSQILRNLVTYWQNNNTTAGIADCFLGEYISLYGLEDFDISMQTIEVVTQHMTCEFAVRPFFLRYGEKMLQQMYLWTHHKSEHVRRLASE